MGRQTHAAWRTRKAGQRLGVDNSVLLKAGRTGRDVGVVADTAEAGMLTTAQGATSGGPITGCKPDGTFCNIQQHTIRLLAVVLNSRSRKLLPAGRAVPAPAMEASQSPLRPALTLSNTSDWLAGGHVGSAIRAQDWPITAQRDVWLLTEVCQVHCSWPQPPLQ